MKIKDDMKIHVWGAIKAVLRGESVVLNAYIRKKERSQINNLSF